MSAMSVSDVRTQCDTFLDNCKPVHRQPATIVRLANVLLRTISFYCKVCLSCVLRDKAARPMLVEYCKRVFLEESQLSSGQDTAQQ